MTDSKYKFVKTRFYLKFFYVIFSVLSVLVLFFSWSVYIEEIVSETNNSKFLVQMLGYVMFGYSFIFCFNTFFFSKIYNIYLNDLYIKSQYFGAFIINRLDEEPVILHRYLYVTFVTINCFFVAALVFTHFLLSSLNVNFECLDFKNWMFVISLQVSFTLLVTAHLKAKIYN